MNARSRLGVLTAALALGPSIAQAHLVTTGLGPMYDGMSHFALSPEEVFPVVALAFFAGLRGPGLARYVLFLLPAAWTLGGLSSHLGLSAPNLSVQIGTAAIFLVVGGMLVTEAFEIGGLSPHGLHVPRIASMVTAVSLGLIRGNADMTGFTTGNATAFETGLLPLSGVLFAVFMVTALAASLSLPLTAMWARVAVCVTGSWSAALGLLLIGWSIHLSMIGGY